MGWPPGARLPGYWAHHDLPALQHHCQRGLAILSPPEISEAVLCLKRVLRTSFSELGPTGKEFEEQASVLAALQQQIAGCTQLCAAICAHCWRSASGACIPREDRRSRHSMKAYLTGYVPAELSDLAAIVDVHQRRATALRHAQDELGTRRHCAGKHSRDACL